MGSYNCNTVDTLFSPGGIGGVLSMLLQRTWVPIQAPMPGGSELPVTPIPNRYDTYGLHPHTQQQGSDPLVSQIWSLFHRKIIMLAHRK